MPWFVFRVTISPVRRDSSTRVGCGRLQIAVVMLLVLADRLSIRGDDSVAAKEQRHWSFRPLQESAVPTTNDVAGSDLDRFVLSRLEAQGLSFGPEADRRTLCRRLFLDLTGLPPQLEDAEQFVRDASPLAVEHLVDRLLASPEYGERWGRRWLDVVGYADSNGYIRHDSPRPLAYRFRDYVIQSLNDDQPYDQLWREQLAGDEIVNDHDVERLTPDDFSTLAATHFLRNPPDGTDNTEGNEITRVMERYAVLESLLQTTMSAMFGITIDCARCHDHKFDPISQRDYYSLQAIFYPAFNVKAWVQPKDRWIYAASPANVAAWKTSQAQADQEIAILRQDLQAWIVAHRPPGESVWNDAFSETSLKTSWSATAPHDVVPAGAPLTSLDADVAPAAKIDNGRLSLLAAGSGDSRWLVSQRVFDWTPSVIGEWIQLTFDLVESRGANGQPAERIGYYIALHDYHDDSPIEGGNLLIDGNPQGGASVVLDYPGGDQKGLGAIGNSGYMPGRNFGVRITRTADDEYLLEHLADGEPEGNSLKLTAAQLPDGGLGFELCCSRSFVVDTVSVESSGASSNNPERARLQQEFTRELQQRQQMLAESIARVNAGRIAEPGKIAWATDLSPTSPEVPLLKRGDYFQPGELSAARPLSVLIDDESDFQPQGTSRTTGRRLSFATWATKPGSRAAALLARVQADRMWRGHFGKGLVPTPENFGASGVGPTHPELLDWLAQQLVAHGWRQKAVHRLIVLSQTYRQSAWASDAALERDPSNDNYSRFPSHRLEAEQIRDSMLAVAGVLNPKRGGPAVEPIDNGHRQIVLAVPLGDGPHEVDRRSIYIRYRRSQPLTFLRTFDQASPDPNCVARGNSTVVGQSLSLLNGEFSVRMGQEFAQRLQADPAVNTIEGMISLAFQQAFLRDPTAEELQRSVVFVESQAAARGGEAALQSALGDFCRLLLAANEFLYLP